MLACKGSCLEDFFLNEGQSPQSEIDFLSMSAARRKAAIASNSTAKCSASPWCTSIVPVDWPLRWRKVKRNVLPGWFSSSLPKSTLMRWEITNNFPRHHGEFSQAGKHSTHAGAARTLGRVKDGDTHRTWGEGIEFTMTRSRSIFPGPRWRPGSTAFGSVVGQFVPPSWRGVCSRRWPNSPSIASRSGLSLLPLPKR
jgi:hypothetical protein